MDSENIRIVDKKQHVAFHILFGNRTIAEIVRQLRFIFPRFYFMLETREKDEKPIRVRRRKCWTEEKPKFSEQKLFSAWKVLFGKEVAETDLRRAVSIINWWTDPRFQIVVAWKTATTYAIPKQEFLEAA